MNTIAKLIISGILALLLHSCNFNLAFSPGVRGNGVVVSETREINSDFTSIVVSRGLDVYISQGGDYSISVEADENLHDIIITTVENNILKIYTDDNISHSSSQKVFVNAKTIESIEATSGSDVFSDGVITSSQLTLITSSGADIDVEVKSEYLKCNASSGSDLKVAGNTERLQAKATSGSDINAKYLLAKISKVEANSGADIIVNSSKELSANANSGGDVRYLGNPEKLKKSDGVSGSIRKN